MADKVFRSWAEDYAHNDREWRYDPDKVRRAMQIRRAARNQLHLQNHNGNAARAAIERAAEQERRRNDPLEQAKAWLGTHLRVPVYAASVAGGPEGKIVVGRTLHSPEEVIEMARAGAERLREKAARAPAVQATTPASAAPSPLVLIRPIAPPAATATPEPQAPNAEAPHPDITPPPMFRAGHPN